MKIERNHTNSFFTELTLTVLFFAVSAMVILHLFAAASQTARQSGDLSGAVLQAQTIAEEVRGLSAPGELPASLQRAEKTGANRYRLRFDQAWKPTAGQPYYTVDVTLRTENAPAGATVRAEICVSRERASAAAPLYTLHSSKYLPRAN